MPFVLVVAIGASAGVSGHEDDYDDDDGGDDGGGGISFRENELFIFTTIYYCLQVFTIIDLQ